MRPAFCFFGAVVFFPQFLLGPSDTTGYSRVWDTARGLGISYRKRDLLESDFEYKESFVNAILSALDLKQVPAESQRKGTVTREERNQELITREELTRKEVELAAADHTTTSKLLKQAKDRRNYSKTMMDARLVTLMEAQELGLDPAAPWEGNQMMPRDYVRDLRRAKKRKAESAAATAATGATEAAAPVAAGNDEADATAATTTATDNGKTRVARKRRTDVDNDACVQSSTPPFEVVVNATMDRMLAASSSSFLVPKRGECTMLHFGNEDPVMVQALRLVSCIEDGACWGALVVRTVKPKEGKSELIYLPTENLKPKEGESELLKLRHEQPLFFGSNPGVKYFFCPLKPHERPPPKPFHSERSQKTTTSRFPECVTWEELVQSVLDENVDAWDEAEEDAEFFLQQWRRTTASEEVRQMYIKLSGAAKSRTAEAALAQCRLKKTKEGRLMKEAALAFIGRETRALSLNDRHSKKSTKRQSSAIRAFLRSAL